MQESLEESHNSCETESDDDTVTLQHKTPLKVDVNKNFETKTMQQQDYEAHILKQQQDKTPDTYTDNGETLDNNIDTYTPETDDKKLQEIHIWPNNKHFICTEDQFFLLSGTIDQGTFVTNTYYTQHSMQ